MKTGQEESLKHVNRSGVDVDPDSGVRRIDFDGLVDAYFDARRYATSAKELRDYHATRLRLLEEAFGCRLPKDPGEEVDAWRREARREDRRDRQSVRFIAHRALESSAGLFGPFGSYLAGVPGALESQLREQFRPMLDESIHQLRVQYRTLFRAALALLYPEIVGRTVSERDLIEAGLPSEAPDPDDFW